MTSLSQPIAGNQSFSGVSNVAGQMASLSVADGSASKLSVQSLEVKGSTAVNDGAYTLTTVTGYAPVQFRTAVLTQLLYFLFLVRLDRPRPVSARWRPLPRKQQER